MTKPKKRAYSGRGGERERIPEPLKKQIMAFAHKLDDGTVQNQTGINDELLKLIALWQSKVEGKESQPRWSNVNKLLLELQSIITPPSND
jgi:hypothetical protein